MFPPTGTYSQAYSSTFSDSELPKATPTFSSHLTIQSAISRIYINPEGQRALQAILWVLNHSLTNVSFSPTLTNIAGLLLVYTSEFRCFEIIEIICILSNEKKELLEMFLPLDGEQLRQVVGIICKIVYIENDGVMTYMKAKNIDFEEAVADIVKNFFVGYFKLPFLLRALMWMLADGIRAIIKLAVSVVVITSECFSEFRNDFITDFKKACYSFDNDEQIFTQAKKLKILKNVTEDLNLPNLKNLTFYRYIRPRCEIAPKLISMCELEIIWANIPSLFQHHSVEQFFSTASDGFSLRALLRKAQSLKRNSATLLLIKSESREITGAFFDVVLASNEKFVGTNNCFVFTLRPELKMYFSTGANDMFAFVSETILLFGGGYFGSALTIDKELLHCTSSKCLTFNNPVLISESFDLIELEVLTIVS